MQRPRRLAALAEEAVMHDLEVVKPDWGSVGEIAEGFSSTYEVLLADSFESDSDRLEAVIASMIEQGYILPGVRFTGVKDGAVVHSVDVNLQRTRCCDRYVGSLDDGYLTEEQNLVTCQEVR